MGNTEYDTNILNNCAFYLSTEKETEDPATKHMFFTMIRRQNWLQQVISGATNQSTFQYRANKLKVKYHMSCNIMIYFQMSKQKRL